MSMSEKELREFVMKKKGTEKPFTGSFWNEHARGTYVCAGCGAQLFSSDTKFDSGTGWPSFDQALPGAVEQRPDNSLFRKRTEVICAKCGGHLGHVFDDYGSKGPATRKATTGEPKRFCINSCALDLHKEGE